MQYAGDILVVDDEPAIVELIAEVLMDEGYSVRTAFTPEDARTAIAERRPDLMLLDIYLRGEKGDALARDLNSDGRANVSVILMTADAKAAGELSMESIAYCLLKPFDLDELVDCVTKHIRRNSAT